MVCDGQNVRRCLWNEPPGSLFSVCHIPSSKRQHDAADYERGRQAGQGGMFGGTAQVRRLVWQFVHLCGPVIRFKDKPLWGQKGWHIWLAMGDQMSKLISEWTWHKRKKMPWWLWVKLNDMKLPFKCSIWQILPESEKSGLFCEVNNQHLTAGLKYYIYFSKKLKISD